MTRVLASLVVLAAIMGLCSCSSNQSSKSSGKKVIAVIPKGETHEFWKSVHAGAEQAGAELGVEIQWKGPTKEDARREQIDLVENTIARKVDAIVLAPLDFTALKGPVEQAAAKNIPVVIIDSDVDSKSYVSFVATDNHAGGIKAGHRLAELMGEKGNVLLLRYQVGSASTDAREAGFLEAIKLHPGMKLVMEDYGGATSGEAQNKAESMLARAATEKTRIDGIFCPNESVTRGMLNALENAQLAGKIRFVGFDAGEALVKAMAAGKIQGLVLQDPWSMGYQGVKAAVAQLEGKPVALRIDTGATMATPETMNGTAISKLLNPPQK